MTDSVYQRVLGSEIESTCSGAPQVFFGESGCGGGQRGFRSCRFAAEFSATGARLSGLASHPVPQYARDVPFDIVNTPTADGALDAVRTFHFPGRDRPLEDTIRVVDGRLHDFLGKRRGFEVRMALTITNGLLEMRSTRQWLHLGKLRIRLPRFATVTVSESWQDGRQHVDVRLRSPILGEWFRYAGSFSYRYQER